jgi:hypothetical protein
MMVLLGRQRMGMLALLKWEALLDEVASYLHKGQLFTKMHNDLSSSHI